MCHQEVVIEEPSKPPLYKPDPEVDIVSVHRLAVEALNRMAMVQDRTDDREFANAIINFIQVLNHFVRDVRVV